MYSLIGQAIEGIGNMAEQAEHTDSAPKLRGHIFYVPEDVAQTPAEGECLVARYWTVHPEKGLAFYYVPTGYFRSDEPSPQCNCDRFTAETLTARIHPGHSVKLIPVVFFQHAVKAMGKHKAALRTQQDS